MVCDVTLVCVQVRIVILIKELALLAGPFLEKTTYCRFHPECHIRA